MFHDIEMTIRFKKLKSRLQLRTYEAIGIVEGMYQFAVKNAILGDVGRYTNEDIAFDLEWEKDPDELINAFYETGWLDAHDDPAVRFVVHEWADIAPEFIKKRVRRMQERDPQIKYFSEEAVPYADGGRRQTTAADGIQRRTTASDGGRRRPTAADGRQRRTAATIGIHQ